MNVHLRDPSPLSLTPLVAQASYWMPDLMIGSAWVEHAPFGFWIVNALRPRTIVELGVHRGFSYFVLCQAVQRLHLPSRCFAIDTWTGDEHAGFYGEETYDAVCLHNRRYESFSRLIRSDFSDACDEFEDGSIDLLHIDGCHTFELVQRDFETWLPKMSRRGVMLLHDTAEYSNGFGVHRIWEKLCRRYPHFEFRHGHGLGVLGVGDRPPVPVRELFQASARSASAQAVRISYERLGGFIGSLQKLEERGVEIEGLVRDVGRLEAVVHSYQTSRSWRLTAPVRWMVGLIKSTNNSASSERSANSERQLGRLTENRLLCFREPCLMPES